LLVHFLISVLKTRAQLQAENLALRQQLAVFKAKRPRPRVNTMDRWFWVALRCFWSGWANALIIVQPATVVRWHRAGLRLYWRWKSRYRPNGRPRVDPEIRGLVRRMARDNPTWGAPRVHGELLKLGFEVSERTVSRYMPKRPAPAGSVQRWMTFLQNHRSAIAGMDFFTVPTVHFAVLYVFFVIHHQRDAKFSAEVVAMVRAMRIEPSRTSFRSPWQNGVAERWVLSVRRELLDHVAGCQGHRNAKSGRAAPPVRVADRSLSRGGPIMAARRNAETTMARCASHDRRRDSRAGSVCPAETGDANRPPMHRSTGSASSDSVLARDR